MIENTSKIVFDVFHSNNKAVRSMQALNDKYMVCKGIIDFTFIFPIRILIKIFFSSYMKKNIYISILMCHLNNKGKTFIFSVLRSDCI